MKRIITTVGTSLLTNALGTNTSRNLGFKRTKGLRFNESENRKHQIDEIKRALKKYIERTDASVSAEIDSIIKIANEYKEECDVYLIATDTIQSPICAEYIQKWFEQKNTAFISTIHFRNSAEFIIEDLQVKEKQAFERKGLTNLFDKINAIAGEYWDNIVFNITGGYKSLIPFMSITAQINNVLTYYNFQETKDDHFDLLKIPNIPINVDYALFDKYWEEIEKIATTGEIIDNYQLRQDLESILEIEGDMMILSSLGYVLWGNYKSRYFLFYCPDDVYKSIENTDELKKIIQEDFSRMEMRLSHINPEPNNHKLTYKRARSVQRIYYFYDNEGIPLVYKVFNNHDAHEKYFNSVKFTDTLKMQLLKESKIRKLEIIK
jgi:CRISPR/Cas system-associated protein Csm6